MTNDILEGVSVYKRARLARLMLPPIDEDGYRECCGAGE